MKHFKWVENKYALALLSVSAVFFFLISYLSDATYDPGDGIRHYLVSRYSWQHPDLLLYSWGKPFFTILSSPFSQFGLIGMNVFNILCGIGAAYFTFKTAQKLGINNALLAIVFLLFTPCYFPTLNSGLTEPLFSLVLIVSIYFFISEKYIPSAILLSFLPFVRTEGNFIIFLFIIVFVIRRKYFSMLFLGSGSLVYSIVGLFYFNDFFWIINQNPYNGDNKAFYGSGDLLHFVNNYNFILGTVLTVLFCVGLLSFIWIIFRATLNKKIVEGKLPEEFFLIYGSFLIYFIAHSIMWWKGLANSLGLLRVIAAVAPCSALICLRGLNAIILPVIDKNKIIKFSIVGIIVLLVIRSPFKHEYFPYRYDQEQTVIKQAGDWFVNSEFKDKKVYYLYPLLAHVLNIDSFNPDKVGELWGLYPAIKEWGIGVIPDSTIVIWDAHFGPNECRIPLDTIMNDPNFKLIKKFNPDVPFTTLGGYNFEVYAFMKLKEPQQVKMISNKFYDFESSDGLENIASIHDGYAFSGNKSIWLNNENEYGATVKIRASELPIHTSRIVFRGKYYSDSKDSSQALLVLSIDNIKNENINWYGRPLKNFIQTDVLLWKNFECSFVISPGSLQNDEWISIYVWNKGKQIFYIDDCSLSFFGKE